MSWLFSSSKKTVPKTPSTPKARGATLTEEEKKEEQSKIAKQLIKHIKKERKQNIQDLLNEDENVLLKQLDLKAILLKEYVSHAYGEQVNNSPLSFACETSTREVCKTLFKFVKEDSWFIEDDVYDYTAIHCAAINPSDEVLQLLLEEKPNILKENINIGTTRYHNTPLHIACNYKGREKTVTWLLNHGAKYDSLNDNEELPLHKVASNGDKEMFKVIFSKHQKEEDKHKRTEEIKLSKQRVENVLPEDWDTAEKGGETDPLDTENDMESELKKYKTDSLSIPGENGKVPLLYAAMSLNFECINVILNEQKNATVIDEDCNTALHFVCKEASDEELALILKEKGDINTKTTEEEMRKKCQMLFEEKLADLLKANALLGVKNEVGNTPLDWINRENMKNMLDNHIGRKRVATEKGNTSQKDRVQIMIENLFGRHSSGADMKNILSLAKSPKHEDLSLHPLCQSILSIKWQKIQKYFLIKLLFFVPLVVLISAYSILITVDKQPIVETSVSDTNVSSTNTGDSKDKIDNLWITIYVLLMIQIIFGTLSVLVLLTPFINETRTYLHNFNKKRALRLIEFYYTQLLWSDWYEYLVWILTFQLLYDKIPPIIAAVFSWFSLFIVCSIHPDILPYRYILFEILGRYIVILVFAFGLIGGFSVGFFLIMTGCVDDENGTKKSCVEGAFENIYLTSLKVPSMMMGEISFDTFNFDHASPWVYILFGGFIFLITCCLFNMMNGLAVNITDKLLEKSLIFKTIAQCEMIIEFEALLNAISDWITWLGFKKMSFFSPIYIEGLKVSPTTCSCKIIEEFDEQTHGDISKFDDNDIIRNGDKTWVWISCGFTIDREIVGKADEIAVNAEVTEQDYSDDEDDNDNGVLPKISVTNEPNSLCTFLKESDYKASQCSIASQEGSTGDGNLQQ